MSEPRIRVTVHMTGRRRWALVWLASLIVAVWGGWMLGRLPAPVERAGAEPVPRPVFEPLIGALDTEAVALEQAARVETPVVEKPKPRPKKVAARQEPPKPEVPAPIPVEPVEEVETEPPPPSALVRALQASRADEAGDSEPARETARQLLHEHPSYTELMTALVADGAEQIQASLTALRMVQLAGLADISRDVARQLLQIYGATERVAESIERWEILRPYIDTVDSSIGDRRWVTVSGTVSNPDVVTVRRLRVRITALDGARNVLGTAEGRVRPKALAAGASGTFSIELKGIDPSTVLRTRAAVSSWESEVRRR
jgi:hypothetical protein